MDYSQLFAYVQSKKKNIEDQCNICYLDNDKYSTTLPCNHKFHWLCINNFILNKKHTKCPYCGIYFSKYKLKKKCIQCKKNTFFDSKKCKNHSIIKNKCSHILSTGKNKGKNCSRYCITNEKFCKLHLNKKNYCSHILLTGKNKGKNCSKLCLKNENYCKIHLHKYKINL